MLETESRDLYPVSMFVRHVDRGSEAVNCKVEKAGAVLWVTRAGAVGSWLLDICQGSG